MVLLVPDDSDDVTEDVTSSVETSGQPKAELDDTETSKASQKVDLDLDDAPFLEDEDDEEEEEAILPVEVDEIPLLEEESSKFNLGALFRNKLVLIFLAIILLLVGVVIFLLLRSPSEAPPPPPEPEPIEEVAPPPPVVEEEPLEPPDILVRLDPFLVEQRDKDDKIRFLEVRLILSTKDDGLARQFRQDIFTVRNAVYYYLKNKDLRFLSDKKNSERLKEELLAIINQYMGFGQFETLLFEQYLVR